MAFPDPESSHHCNKINHGIQGNQGIHANHGKQDKHGNHVNKTTMAAGVTMVTKETVKIAVF
jgi:hypothetical protein